MARRAGGDSLGNASAAAASYCYYHYHAHAHAQAKHDQRSLAAGNRRTTPSSSAKRRGTVRQALAHTCGLLCACCICICKQAGRQAGAAPLRSCHTGLLVDTSRVSLPMAIYAAIYQQCDALPLPLPLPPRLPATSSLLAVYPYPDLPRPPLPALPYAHAHTHAHTHRRRLLLCCLPLTPQPPAPFFVPVPVPCLCRASAVPVPCQCPSCFPPFPCTASPIHGPRVRIRSRSLRFWH